MIDDYIKIRGTSNEIDSKYKAFVLCIIELICKLEGYLVYLASYAIFNVSHHYAVFYNISSSNYS